MMDKKNIIGIILNNLIFLGLILSLALMGLTGIFKRPGIYGGLDLLLPLLLITIILYFIILFYRKEDVVKLIGLKNKIIYMYFSYLLAIIIYGTLFWNEGLATVLIYTLLTGLPLLNVKVFEKYKNKK